MEVGTISTFKRAIFVLFVVLVPAQCSFQNAYTWNVTCETPFLIVRFRFEKPFKGVIYAEHHKYEPACSFRAPPTSNISEVTFKIDSSSCGTSARPIFIIGRIISLNVRIQQHTILETYNDITQPVSCSFVNLENPSESYFQNPPKPVKRLPKMLSKLEIKQGYAALGTKLALELELSNKSLLVFSVPNNGVIKDISIRNCLLHDQMILDEDSLFYQITHPSGCQNASSEIVSAFKVVNSTETGNLVAYAQMKRVRSFLTDKSVFLSCGAQLCKRICRQKCPRKSRSVVTAVATHIISKRSTNGISGLSTRKTSDVGSRFMKSTIKSILRKFLQQAMAQNDTNFELQAKAQNDTNFELQAKVQNDSNFQKRAMHVSPKESSTVPADIGIPAYSFKNTNVEFTNSSRDYELGMYGNTDDMSQLEEEYNENSSTPGNITYTTPRWFANQNQSTMTILTAKMEDVSEKRKQRELFEKEEHEFGNSEDREVSNSYNETLITDEPTEFEIFNIETFNFTTLPNISLQATATEIEENELGTEDYSENKSIGNCSMNWRENRSSESDFERSLNGSCVSQLTFLIVTILLGFIIFTLLLVCIGMALYIKKEKKRHLIDNFLLYSFY